VTAAFDPADFDRTARATVPGYAWMHELVALAVAGDGHAAPRVLDVGCGTGAGLDALARALPGASLFGCDSDPRMARAAHARCAARRATVHPGGVEAMDVGAPPFNAVVSTLVLHFVPPADRTAWLGAVYARLAPGGLFVVTALTRGEPSSQALWSSLRAAHAARHGVSAEQLAQRTALTASGVSPLDAGALPAQLADAGFCDVAPLFQLLAVRAWCARRPAEPRRG
jgi:tRNA (cmo5U34)-methyltransferase